MFSTDEIIYRFKKLNIKNPWKEYRILLSYCLNKSYEEILFSFNKINLNLIDPKIRYKLSKLILRRLKYEPLSKIIGRKEFWGLDFKVNNYTLDPRPETEFIIEEVLDKKKNKNYPYKILDIGTGTGCLLISLLKEYKNSTGTGIDLCTNALIVARENSIKHSVQERCLWIKNDWISNFWINDYDIIISNPPYIPLNTPLHPSVKYDPTLSLYGGSDGLLNYKIIISSLKKSADYLDALIVLEIGYNQYLPVRKIIEKTYKKQTGIYLRYDLNSHPRVISYYSKDMT